MIYSLRRQFRKLNWRVIANISGYVLIAEAGLMLFPLICALMYGERQTYPAFLISIGICLVLGFALSRIKTKHTSYFARDGLLAVGLAWLVLSIFGALPFYISGAIPKYVDCFFETVSGFTTTGSSILTEIETLPHGILFWRSFTHWVGGMGILVFVLAIIPKANERSMHILRAESPGPVIGKLVPRLQKSALILYAIYMGLTVLEMICLLVAGMPLFDTLCNTFGSAGTGGFGILNQGIAQYQNPVYEMIIGIFITMFGINFNFYFFVLIRNFKEAWNMSEVKTYICVVAIATGLIACNILPLYDGSVWDALRLAFFQVASIITTTGYSTANFDLWPTFSKIIILLLMVSGACAGSTGGGMKVSRLMIIMKKVRQDILKNNHPNRVESIKMDGKNIDPRVVDQIMSYFGCFMLLVGFITLIVSLDGFDFETTVSSVFACIGNIGPGFGLCGPFGNFSMFSNLSKIILSFAMLIGRLEIYPILIFLGPVLSKHKKIRKTID